MEGSTITAAAGRAVDAPTVTEALRRTAANHPDVVAVRTVDDTVSLTWSELLGRVDALAGGLAGLGVGRGDTVAIMLGNRPEFHIVDHAVAMLGATPFSIYQTYPAEEIEYLITDAASKIAIVEQAYLRGDARGTQGAARPRARDRDRRRRSGGDDRAGRRRGLEPRVRRCRRGGRGRGRRRADADLHLGHDRAPEGRPALPSRDHGLGEGDRGDHPARGRWPAHLVAARRPHRRADGPPLRPDDLRRHDHDLLESA